MRRYLFAYQRLGGSAGVAVGSLQIDEAALGLLRQSMSALRDALAWRSQALESYFEAGRDTSAIRTAVFAVLAEIEFSFDCTFVDKRLVGSALFDECDLVRRLWQTHLGQVASAAFSSSDDVMVVADIDTRRRRRAFHAAIEDATTHALSGCTRGVLACRSPESDCALQAAEYCLWAVCQDTQHSYARYHRAIRGKVRSRRALSIWDLAIEE